ncbi:MAG: ABC transporter permease [Beijerinckiaceae bacterium]
MRLRDALGSAFDALRAHKLRSLLTMLGIVIGVAAVIATVSIGGGAREEVVGRIRSLGANLIIVIPGNVTQGGVRLGTGQSATLTDDDARAIEKEVRQVQVAAPQMRGGAQVVFGGTNWGTSVFGVENNFFEAREWDIETGRLFTAEENQRGGQVALLGLTVKNQLFGDDAAIGQTIRVRNVPFEVIGVMARKGQSAQGQDQDDAIFLPLSSARQRVLGSGRARSRTLGSILVKVREGEDMAETEGEIRSLIRQRHRLREGEEDDFTIRNLTDILSTVEASARVLSIGLASVAAVSLLVGGIGIMNIMLVSVTERTREIGVRMAVGARPRDVLRQFLIEATTLAVIGGLAGVALGGLGAQIVSHFAGWPLYVDINAIVLAVVVSGLIGILSGFYPAWRASRLDPVAALRSA